MMHRFVASVVALTVLILGSGTPALAQNAVQPLAETETAVAPATTEERLTLRAGDVFEMIADPGVNDATYSWILTQERRFIEAGRERLFRYRFVQEQTYTLRADVALPTGERRQRTFIIAVLGQGDASISPVYPAGTGASLAGTVPAPDTNGRVVLTPSQHVLQLSPMRADLSPLALDLDAARDTDADGNPANDIDNTGTYFHSFGRSLWIWFARPLTATDMIITAVPPGSSPLVQRISILSQEIASSQGVLTSSVIIRVEQIDDSTFGLTPEFPRPVPGDSPLLYEWEFGDGTRSLETNPVHQYTSEGDFIVKLHVRDLGTGETVGRSEANVSPILPVDEPVDEPDPLPVDEPDPEPVDEPSDGDGLPWGRILLIIAIFMGSLAVGIAIVWLIAFLRKSRSLEQTLESMEKVVAPSKEQTPPPLAIKSKPQGAPAQAQQKVIDAEISAASPTPVSAPISEAAAPAWLKKGLAADQSAPSAPTPAAPPTPKPAPVPPPSQTPQASAIPAPAPATKAPATPAAPVVSKAAPAPSFAQKPQPAAPPVQKPQPTATPAPTPKPMPAPQPPKAAPTPVQPKTVAPPTIAKLSSVDDPPAGEAPDPAKLPRWLQPSTPAPTTPQTNASAVPRPAPVTPPKPAAAPIIPSVPKPQSAVAPVAPPTPNTPAAALPKPTATPQPPKVAPVPTPAQPTPVTTPVVSPSAAATAPVPTKHTPAATTAPIIPPTAPMPAPAPMPPAPAVMPVMPPAATSSPAQQTTSPTTPSSSPPSVPKNDDDRPIAIIRADSLDPEPPK